MKNLVWLVVAAVIALGAYMLFTGKGPQEVAVEASDALNAPGLVEEISDAAQETGEALTEATEAAGEAVNDVVDDATQSANEAAREVEAETDAEAEVETTE